MFQLGCCGYSNSTDEYGDSVPGSCYKEGILTNVSNIPAFFVFYNDLFNFVLVTKWAFSTQRKRKFQDVRTYEGCYLSS